MAMVVIIIENKIYFAISRRKQICRCSEYFFFGSEFEGKRVRRQCVKNNNFIKRIQLGVSAKKNGGIETQSWNFFFRQPSDLLIGIASIGGMEEVMVVLEVILIETFAPKNVNEMSEHTN